jgi:hypothetical protein
MRLTADLVAVVASAAFLAVVLMVVYMVHLAMGA